MIKLQHNHQINFDNYNFEKIYDTLNKKEEMLDWLDIDTCISKEELEKVKNIANDIKEKADVFIVIGIGGSFLGAKAIIDALSPYFDNNSNPELIFLGNNLSSEYLTEVMKHIENKNVYVNVISKSGNTLEPSLAFDIIYNYLKENDKNYKDKIIVTTDKESGKLRQLVNEKHLTSLEIPINISGRFSCLTSVGLLPCAVKNINIDELLAGANDAKKYLDIASEYALLRYKMEQEGFLVEAFTYCEPKLEYFGRWFQQLFGESQGKNKKGIFPTCNLNSTNLHALEQYFQDGRDILFETILMINKFDNPYQEITDLNNFVMDKVCLAHKSGNTPDTIIELDRLTPYTLGELIYFFELSCAIGGFMMNINPFDQPGVEKYKSLIREKK